MNILKQEYLNLIFPLNKNDCNLQKASNIKNKILSKYLNSTLYKYYSFDDKEYSLNHLKNNTIWLSNVEKFNDPFEIRFYKDTESIINKIKLPYQLKKDIDFIKKEYSNLYKSNEYALKLALFDILNNKIEEVRNKVRVASFSETNNNILMWGHYANSHTGFCVEYDINKNLAIFPIKYSETLLDITNFALLEHNKRNEHYLYISVLTKFIDWQYEKEWRLLEDTKNDDTGQYFNNITPKAVYMGISILLQNQEMLINICKSKNIPLYKMKMDTKKYKLSCEILDDGSKKDYTKSTI